MAQSDSLPSPPVKKANKRSSRRQKPKGSSRASAYRNALGLGPNIARSILDLSETGVRLLLKEPLKIGQEFEINFESVGGRTAKLLAIVAWIVPAADGNYVIGARFEKSLGYPDLAALARP